MQESVNIYLFGLSRCHGFMFVCWHVSLSVNTVAIGQGSVDEIFVRTALGSVDEVLCKGSRVVLCKKVEVFSLLMPSGFIYCIWKFALKYFLRWKVGMVLPGFTRQFMPYGVFVEFSPNIYGLVPNSVSAPTAPTIYLIAM